MYLQKSVELKDLLPCLLFIAPQMFSVLHKWRYFDPRARDRISQSAFVTLSSKHYFVVYLKTMMFHPVCALVHPCVDPEIFSVPRKLRSKNPKVALNLWQKLRKKLR